MDIVSLFFLLLLKKKQFFREICVLFLLTFLFFSAHPQSLNGGPIERSIKQAEFYRYNSPKKDSAAYYYVKTAQLFQKKQAWEQTVKQYLNAIFMLRLNQGFSLRFSHIQTCKKIAEAHLAADHPLLGDIYALLSMHYSLVLELDQMKLFGQKAMKIFQALPLPYSIDRHYAMGSILTDLERDEEAIVHLNYVLQIADTLLPINESDVRKVGALDHLGRIYHRKGDFKGSIRTLDQLKAWAVARKQEAFFEVLHMNYGANYEQLGDWERALEHYRLCRPSRVRSLALSNLFQFILQPDSAEQYLSEALTMGPGDGYQLELPEFEGQLYSDAGQFYYKQGKDSLGEFYFGLAESWLSSHTFPLVEAELWIRRAMLTFKDGREERTFRHIQKAINIFHLHGIKQHHDLALCYTLLGKIKASHHKWQDALNQYHQGIQALSFTPYTKDSLPSAIHVVSLHQYLDLLQEISKLGLASDSPQQQDLQRSYRSALMAMEVINAIRQHIRRTPSKEGWAKTAVSVCELGIEICHSLYTQTQSHHYLQQALVFSEQSKSILLHESLQRQHAMSFAGLPDSILQQEHNLQVNLQYYWQALQEKKQNQEEDSSILIYFQERAAFYQEAYHQFQEYLEKQFPNYHQIAYAQNIPAIDNIQKNMDEHSVILEYFYGDSSIYVITIGPSQTGFRRLDISQHYREQLEKILSMIHRLPNEFNFASLLPSLHSLYQWLIAPSFSDIEAAHRLLIIPDGQLGYLPFDILIKEPGTKVPDYLIRHYSISYANSIRFLKRKRAQDMNSEPFIGFGPSYSGELYLPYTKEEVKTIRKILGGKAFVGQHSIESTFRQHAPFANILHLATHGFPNTEDPLSSYLLFQKDSLSSGDEGKLHAFELYHMELSAQLTVLSACHTGYGPIARGEGIQSLALAFQYAGCPSVVMSLWETNGLIAKDLMPMFYRNLTEGLPKDEALRQAKLNFLASSPDHLHDPRMWANFVLIGDSTPLNEPDDSGWMWWLILGLGIFFLVYFSRRR